MEPTGTFIDQMPCNSVVPRSKVLRTKRCLSCGTDRIEPRRRYCSNGCRRQMTWVLSLSKGLLKAINARYAAFYFTDNQVVLDVLSVWSKQGSRFSFRRRPNSLASIIWIAMERRTDSSVGVVTASSYEFVCSELQLSLNATSPCKVVLISLKSISWA